MENAVQAAAERVSQDLFARHGMQAGHHLDSLIEGDLSDDRQQPVLVPDVDQIADDDLDPVLFQERRELFGFLSFRIAKLPGEGISQRKVAGPFIRQETPVPATREFL